ncbi:hypothetical protein [Actinomadura yumaensis]|uniref:ATP-binding protein n=1 Tax=Actinomadura yumaensis TaxID=111807 RepID=A0ABW2CQV7_9ACTN
MNRSAKKLMRTSVLVPVAAMVAVGFAPAHASGPPRPGGPLNVGDAPVGALTDTLAKSVPLAGHPAARSVGTTAAGAVDGAVGTARSAATPTTAPGATGQPGRRTARDARLAARPCANGPSARTAAAPAENPGAEGIARLTGLLGQLTGPVTGGKAAGLRTRTPAASAERAARCPSGSGQNGPLGKIDDVAAGLTGKGPKGVGGTLSGLTGTAKGLVGNERRAAAPAERRAGGGDLLGSVTGGSPAPRPATGGDEEAPVSVPLIGKVPVGPKSLPLLSGLQR